MTNAKLFKPLKTTGKTYKNLDIDTLIKHSLLNENTNISSTGALLVDTGIFTGRSPKDKYITCSKNTKKDIAWGEINQYITQDIYNYLSNIAKTYLSTQNLYITDVYCGSSPSSRKSIRFITSFAWQAHFISNMFIYPSKEELATFTPDFTLYNACGTKNDNYKEQGLNSDVFIAFDIDNNEAVIGGTYYAGEMKKGIFFMMNYWLLKQNKLPMHCSANVGKDGDSALFFGLSGTGKTTLSTDKKRALIGDDEHGWDDKGVFNLEGGCYAKVINLKEEYEIEIFGAIKKGAILENVVFDNKKIVDYTNDSKTQNTRVSYPLSHIKNTQPKSIANHPKNIIFLSADAFGVLPPVSKLDIKQTIYYFLNGYTAKIAGTEIGINTPVATFSACFGEAFLPMPPMMYAKLLGEKIQKYDVSVYLVNTGWSGGSYGVGSRISIKDTRACVNSILDGSIEKSEFEKSPIFELNIPKSIYGIKKDILNPRHTWNNKQDYDKVANNLKNMYKENFKKYTT